jgi:hypothetical protein
MDKFIKMQIVSDIAEHKEMHIWNTIWDTIGPYSMKTRFTCISRKDCNNC